MKTIVVLAVSGIALLVTVPSHAEVIGGCPEGSPPGCVPAKPVLPQARYITGLFGFYNQSAGADNRAVIDTKSTGAPYYAYLDSQGAEKVAQDYPGQLKLGNAASGVGIKTILPNGSNEPTIKVSAQHDGVKQGYESGNAYVGISYLLKLHVAGGGLTALQTLIDADPKLATAKGSYTMAVSGTGAQSSASAFTGFDSDPSFAQELAYCYNYPAGATGCGTHDYALPVSFVRGDTFADGAADDFYAQIGITASAYTLNGYPGAAESYIDPTITFSDRFMQAIAALPPGSSISYSVAGRPSAISAVPETSSWAMMTIGFGLLGVARRRRYRGLADA